MITAPKEIEKEALVLVDKWKSVHGDPASNSLPTSATVIAGDPSLPPTPVRSPVRQLKGLDLNQATSGDSYGNTVTRAIVPPGAASPTPSPSPQP
jgi:hypothetical protein